MTQPGEFTRWRSVANPLHPADPIDHASMFKEGHIPVGFIVLLWDGSHLTGPRRFSTQEEADTFLVSSQDVKNPVTHYLVVPMPT